MKKTNKEIKQAILKSLEVKPLSIQQISEKIDSNWLTVRGVIDELLKEQKIRCILSTDKIKIYVSLEYPVFYGVPLQQKHKDASLFLFSEIVRKWKTKYNELPPVTTIQKIAVDVVNECKLDIPVLPFHYGLVIPIFAKPEKLLQINQEKQELEVIKNKQLLIKCINKLISVHKKKAWQEEIGQYKKYNLKFFLAKHNLMFAFKNMDKAKIEGFILELSYEFPNTLNSSNAFSLFHRFLYSSIAILNSKKNDCLELIKEVFESLWDLITTIMFFEKISSFIPQEDKQLFEIIKLSTLNSKMYCSEEKLANLESATDSVNIEEIEMPTNEESIAIRRILTEGAEEE